MADELTLRTAMGRDWVLWLLQQRHRKEIRGNSMWPTLRPGEVVLVDFKAYGRDVPRPGDIVIAQHPHQPTEQIIKRVRDVLDNDHYVLIGDNRAESSDSLAFGAVPRQLILGRVTCRLGSG